MNMNLSLLSDQAIGDTDERRKDGLGFKTYAEILSTAVKETKGPFTIGIFGEWGTGKTSLMKLVKKYLSGSTNIVTVWFNAWRYEQEEHPLVPLVATIIHELEMKKDWRKKLPSGIKKIVNALRAVAYGFSLKSKLKVPGVAELEATFKPKDILESANKFTKDPLLDRSLYYHSLESLSNAVADDDTRIVIFVDDLDRCLPDLAIKLLESIKLVLSQPNFIFFLGVARSVIEGYLRHRYEKEYGLNNFKGQDYGQDYLDKIVQLPFHIPPHTERMGDFSRSLLEQLNEEDQEIFEDILPIIGCACGSNPRRTVRFVNNLLIDRAINDVLYRDRLMEKIPIGYFAVSRSIEQRWPQIYSIFINSDEICTEISQWKNEDIENNIESKDKNMSNIASILIIDLELQQLIFSRIGNEWLENEPMRKAATQFLTTQRNEKLNDVRPGIDYYYNKFKDTKTPISPILAENYAQQGDYEKAIAMYKLLSEDDPGNSLYQNKLKELLEKQKLV